MAVLSFNSATNEWSRSGSFCWLDKIEKHSILAVYPSSYDPFYLVYALPTNQSSPNNLKSADLIIGHWYGSPYSFVTIPMKHRMSLVTIMYHVGTADYPNLDISSPKICHLAVERILNCQTVTMNGEWTLPIIKRLSWWMPVRQKMVK